jgi:hypothetical protein
MRLSAISYLLKTSKSLHTDLPQLRNCEGGSLLENETNMKQRASFVVSRWVTLKINNFDGTRTKSNDITTNSMSYLL